MRQPQCTKFPLYVTKILANFIRKLNYKENLFGLVLNFPVNNFSVMLGRRHHYLGITSTFWGVNMSCSRTQHGDPSGIRTPDLWIRRPRC